MTERYAMAVRLKDEKRDFYISNHANVWPEVLSELKKIKVKNYSIYLKEYKNRIFFNYTKLIEDKIKELGIDNFKTSGFDTYSNPKKFFSHRYSIKNELKDCGRQISLVGYKKWKLYQVTVIYH